MTFVQQKQERAGRKGERVVLVEMPRQLQLGRSERFQTRTQVDPLRESIEGCRSKRDTSVTDKRRNG